MRIVCDVNQAECLRYGVPARSSTVEIDVDPKLLTLEQLNFIVDSLSDGLSFPRNRRLNICPPTYAGFIASVSYGTEGIQEKEKRAIYVALTSKATIRSFAKDCSELPASH
jgi:hypothetical protein